MTYVQQKLTQNFRDKLLKAIGDRHPDTVDAVYKACCRYSAEDQVFICEGAVYAVDEPIRSTNIAWLRRSVDNHFMGCQWVLENAGC